MVIGEDKSKVSNIVKDNIQHFQILYSNILRDCPQVVYKPQQGKLEVKYGTRTSEQNTHLLSLSHLICWRHSSTLDAVATDLTLLTCHP